MYCRSEFSCNFAHDVQFRSNAGEVSAQRMGPPPRAGGRAADRRHRIMTPHICKAGGTVVDCGSRMGLVSCEPLSGELRAFGRRKDRHERAMSGRLWAALTLCFAVDSANTSL